MKSFCFKWEELVIDSDLPAYSKYIALYLRTFMNNKHDMVWPSISRISYETGLSKPTVIKYIKPLEDNGFLSISKKISSTKGGDQLHNVYLITIPEKVVNDINNLLKGSKSQEQRWLNSEAKVVNDVNTNKQRTNNTTNNDFDEFWSLYPRKDSKKKAQSAWRSLTKEKKQKAIADIKTRYKNTEKRFIPLPTTYLHGERWNDEKPVIENQNNNYFLGAI